MRKTIQVGTQSRVEVDPDFRGRRADPVKITVERYDALLETERKYGLRQDQANLETISAERYQNLLEVERKYAEWRDKQAQRADDWDEAKHARDQQGRFSTDATAETLVAKAKHDGGFTHHPSKGTPTSGYIVSSATSEKRGKVIDLADSNVDVKAEVSAYLRKNEGNLGPNEYIGGYIERADPKDGEKEGKHVALHLDISNHFADKAEAIKLGQQRNQISIWDVAKGEEIKTGGTGRELPPSQDYHKVSSAKEKEELRLLAEDEAWESMYALHKDPK